MTIASSRSCPTCGAASLTRTDEVSTEGSVAHRAWQDTDGQWYDGPARQFTATRCKQCGWSEHVTRRRGKIVHSVTWPPMAGGESATVAIRQGKA